MIDRLTLIARDARRLVTGATALAIAAGMTATPAHATFEAGLEAYKSGQYAQALDIWRRFAVAGDVRSKKILGDFYSGYLGKEERDIPEAEGAYAEDYVQALVWYTLAATHDFGRYSDPSAHEVNAQILAQNRLPEVREKMKTSEVATAENYVAQTFEAGSPYDLYRLGRMYQQGLGIDKDNEKALQMFALAKTRGVPEASEAYEVLENRMDAKEIEIAVNRVENWQPPLPPEYTGKTPQQIELERLKKELEEIRLAEALKAVSDIDVELIQRALAALGYRPGSVDNELGPATREAIRRFQYAAVARDLDKSEEEKRSVVTGVLTPRQTVALFEDAARARHPMSEYVFGIMHVRGIGVDQDGQKAVKWLEAAADQNLAIAHYALGVVFRDGTTGLNEVSPDERKSAYHLAQASALGYKPANDALRRLSFEYTRDVQ